jgi:hypothetical protein
MNTAISFLRSIEHSLLSRFGRWAEYVSSKLDSLSAVSITTAMVNAPQAIANLGTATVIKLDTTVDDDGVPYDVSTGLYTLEANSLYELGFYPQVQSFGTEASDFAVLYWADALNNSLRDNCTAVAYPATSSQNACAQPNVHVFYRTGGAAEQVHIHSGGGQGSASIGTDSYAFVRKVRSL